MTECTHPEFDPVENMPALCSCAYCGIVFEAGIFPRGGWRGTEKQRGQMAGLVQRLKPEAYFEGEKNGKN